MDGIVERKAAAMGFDLWKEDTTTQSGKKPGRFNPFLRIRGTKLEGLMTSLQMHDASIDENVENISEGLGRAIDTINKIKREYRQSAEKYMMRSWK